MIATIYHHLPISFAKVLAYHSDLCVANMYLAQGVGCILSIVPFLKGVLGRLLKQPNRTLQLTSWSTPYWRLHVVTLIEGRQDPIPLITTQQLTTSGGTPHFYRQNDRGMADGLLHNRGGGWSRTM